MIKLHNISKFYTRVNSQPQYVLHELSLEISAGQFVAIVGPSGNGKSTLLNLIAGIDRPDQGEIWVNGCDMRKMSENRLATWRRSNMGVVFQFFQLLPTLSLLQNVMLPMDFAQTLPKPARLSRAQSLLAQFGLADAMHRLPSQVSGGQQQRAAIARAMANDPPLIVADEPTGNLDAATADEVFTVLQQLVQQGKTLVMVTHNPALAAAAERQVSVLAGRICADSALVESLE